MQDFLKLHILQGIESFKDDELSHFLEKVDEWAFWKDDKGLLAKPTRVLVIFFLLEACESKKPIARSFLMD